VEADEDGDLAMSQESTVNSNNNNNNNYTDDVGEYDFNNNNADW
jgi:hypothetical protein